MTRLVGWWLLLAVVLTTILLLATQPRPTGRHPRSLGLDLYRQADGLHVAAVESESGGLVPVYAAWLLHNVITGIRADVQSSEATEG